MNEEPVRDFCKVDSHLDSNPKIRKAGFFGSSVFQFLLRVNRKLRRDGAIPIAYVDPFYIVDQLKIPGDDALTIVGKALESCVTARLIEIDETAGVVSIVGWEEDWGMRSPVAGRERTRAWRDRRESGPVTPVTTARHGDAIRSEEKRGEERRSENSLLQSTDTAPTPVVQEPCPPELPEPDPGVSKPAQRGSSAERESVRRRLVTFAWQYAGERYRELEREGIDPSAVPNCWNGLPSANSDEMRELKARIDELLDGKAPTYEAAEDVIKRRIDVAAAEARRDRRRDYMTPPRMWNPKSFSIASSMSPAQASRPRNGPPRAEDRGVTRFKLPEPEPKP